MPCSDQHFIPILDELRMREEDNIKNNLRSSASNQRPSEPVLSRRSARVEGLNKGRGRGGPRPGSGPPKGNLNALKHGRYSRRHKKLLESLLEVPEARQALIDMANRNRERVSKAEIEAAYHLMRWLANNNPDGLEAALDGAAFKIQSENDQARNDQLNKALADMETAFVAKISKNATKKRTAKPKKRPNAPRNPQNRGSLP
jgi:hypothetical protein